MNRNPRWNCATCIVDIRHRPEFHVGLAFCCAGCVAGGPCTCSYDEPLERPTDRRVDSTVDPTSSQVLADEPAWPTVPT